MNLSWVLIAMILAMLIPMYEAWREDDIWQRMLALNSIAAKAAIMILVISVLRGDWMLGVSGAIILSVGNAGFMLLSHLLKRMGDTA